MPGSVDVDTLAESLAKHLSDYRTERLQTTEALKQINDQITEFKALPMKAVTYLGGIVVTAAVTLMVQNYFLHEQTQQSSQAAQVQAHAAAIVGAQTLSKLNTIESGAPQQ